MGSYLQEATLKNPAFQFYPGDFLADPKVQVMSCEEIGAYLLLLLWQWAEGSVPDNLADAIPAGRASRARVKSMLARLDPCFPVGEDGKRRNRKLERVRGERAEFSEQQSGRAKSRWKKEKAQSGTDPAMPRHQSGIATSLPESCRNDAAPHCPTDAGPQCSSSSSSFLREPSVLSSKPPDPEPEPPPEKNHAKTAEKAALERLWNRYLQATDRNPKILSFSLMRQRKGLARLRECLEKTGGDLASAEALMELAIDRIAASDWHMGRDPGTRGKRYCEWEDHLFPSAEKLEKWLADEHAGGQR